jgi:hypothetical protein
MRSPEALRIPVPMSDPEWDRISKRIRESYKNACILWVERVVPSSDIPDAIELFHGTNVNNIDRIVKEGFDVTKNVRSAYGKGTYFSSQANYSKNYAIGGSIVYMFLCNVDTKRCHKFDHIYVMPHNDGAVPKYIIAFHKT